MMADKSKRYHTNGLKDAVVERKERSSKFPTRFFWDHESLSDDRE